MVRLDQINLADFIEICAGDYTPVNGDEKEGARLIAEYNEIVGRTEVAAIIADSAIYEKARCKLGFLSVCKDLINMFDDVGKVKECFELANMPACDGRKGYLGFIERESASTRLIIKRWEARHKNDKAEEPTGKDVRDGFSAQIASLMAFFKMPIDLRSTTALVYAHLVEQARRQSEDLRRSLDKNKR